jgi:hypothetical protein
MQKTKGTTGKLTERLIIRSLLNINPYPDISFLVDRVISWFPQFAFSTQKYRNTTERQIQYYAKIPRNVF